MPELRWILIGCGLVLLIAIYVWGRRSAKHGAASEDASLRMHAEAVAASEPPPDRFARDEPDDRDEEDEPPARDEVPHAHAHSHVYSQPHVHAYVRAEDYSATAIRPARDTEAMAVSSTPHRSGRDLRRARIEPTLDDDDIPTEDVYTASTETAELPEAPAQPAPAPTLGMSSTPAPKRIERRKIIALRLAAGSQRFAGGQLRETLEEENLTFGKYDVFHRLHGDGSHVFSVASMVEPGSFELETMATASFPGVTLFAQLPGPAPGIDAMNELVACGKRLQQNLGGTLQDERGVPLTVHRMERMRQEIRDFESAQERAHGRESRDAGLN